MFQFKKIFFEIEKIILKIQIQKFILEKRF